MAGWTCSSSPALASKAPPTARPTASTRTIATATFTDVTEKAGLKAVGWASGVCVGDYNNDGFEDIFCTYFGQDKLYRNNGDGTFTEVTKEAGVWNDQPRWGAGCTFVDYNHDGHLDLFVSNYFHFSLEHAPVPGENTNCNWKGLPVLCGPRGLPMGRQSLYRNNGDGTFTDVTQQAGIAAANTSYGMTVVAADLDEDGWPVTGQFFLSVANFSCQ